MGQIFHLLYSSKAAGFVSPRMIQDILNSSKRNNEKSGVTGLLVFRSGHFLQLLEGDEAAVLATYQRITEDPRHFESRVLAKIQSDGRVFPLWEMGYIEDPAQSEALSRKLNTLLSAPLTGEDSELKGQILQLFREMSRS